MKDGNIHKEIRDELHQIAPGLNEMKNEDGFTTPHNYFKELPDRVFAGIAEEETKPSPVWSWLQNLPAPRYVMAFGSVVVLIVAGIWFTRVQGVQDPLASITPDEALDYVMENLHEFSSEDLITAGVLTDWNVSETPPVPDEDLDRMIELIEDEGLIEELMIN